MAAAGPIALLVVAAAASVGAMPWALGATQYGSVETEPNQVTVRGAPESIQISGTVRDAGARYVTITISGPGNTVDVIDTVRTTVSGGTFSTTYTILPDWEAGTYYVSGKGGGGRIGQITFEVRNYGAPAQQAPRGASPAAAGILTVATDSATYGGAGEITVYGSGPAGRTVTLALFDPGGTKIASRYANVDGAGTYRASVYVGSTQAPADGQYVVTASQGMTTAEEVFWIRAEPPQQPAQQPSPGSAAPQHGSGAAQRASAQQAQPAPLVAAAAPLQPQQGSPQQRPAQAQTPAPTRQLTVASQPPDISGYVTLAITAALVVAIGVTVWKKVTARGSGAAAAVGAAVWKKVTARGSGGAAAQAGGASVMSFYECPRCYSPDIHNRPDGGALCRNCGFYQ